MAASKIRSEYLSVKALLSIVLAIVGCSMTNAFPGCQPGGSANAITVISDLQFHDTLGYYGDLILDEANGLLFAAVKQQVSGKHLWLITLKSTYRPGHEGDCLDVGPYPVLRLVL